MGDEEIDCPLLLYFMDLVLKNIVVLCYDKTLRLFLLQLVKTTSLSENIYLNDLTF